MFRVQPEYAMIGYQGCHEAEVASTSLNASRQVLQGLEIVLMLLGKPLLRAIQTRPPSNHPITS